MRPPCPNIGVEVTNHRVDSDTQLRREFKKTTESVRIELIAELLLNTESVIPGDDLNTGLTCLLDRSVDRPIIVIHEAHDTHTDRRKGQCACGHLRSTRGVLYRDTLTSGG